MIVKRPSHERGHADHGWLDTYHTFSFAGYHDPAHMGFRALRVINEDWVAPGRGFGAHPHRDMEIITYVLEGALEHKDSMGNHGVIRPGEVQRMSAGTGVVHSEFNPSPTERVHLLQIWIEPDTRGLSPGYEQRTVVPEDKRGRLLLVAGPPGAEGVVTIHQDARLYATLLERGEQVKHPLAADRHAWLHVVSGAVDVDRVPPHPALSPGRGEGSREPERASNGVRLEAGDGAAVSGESGLAIAATRPSEVLVFDLA